MIIGEKFESEYDGYEEDSYDYLFKRKPKAVRGQKRTERKAKHQQKRVDRKTQGKGLLLKKKLPILGNFGMFDKKKKLKPTAEAIPSTEVTPDLPPASESIPPVNTPESNSGPELQIPASVLPPAPTADPVKPIAPSSHEEQLPSEAPATADTDAPVSPAKTSSANTPVVKPTIAATASTAQAEIKSPSTKSNKKEALFSPLVGFACLGVVLMLAGYAFFKSQQKNLVPVKGNA